MILRLRYVRVSAFGLFFLLGVWTCNVAWSAPANESESTFGKANRPTSSADPKSVERSNTDRHPAVDLRFENTSNRPIALIVVYCSLIVSASLLGGWLPSFLNLSHTRMEMMISLVGGLMLGIGLFHMLPHAYAELGSLDQAVWWMMVGLLTMFFLIRMFHFHQHGPVEQGESHGTSTSDHSSHAGHDHDHDHEDGAAHQHDRHGHAYDYAHQQGHGRNWNWVGVALGLSLHTFIDGLALGASVQAGAGHGAWLSLFGLGTFLAVLLHKPLDAVAITSLMTAGGWSRGWQTCVNVGFSIMCPLGAGAIFLGLKQFSDQQHLFIGCALAFSAGVFICISLGDLLPEIQFHSHNRGPLSLMLLAGVAIAYGIGYLEPDHTHQDGSYPQTTADDQPLSKKTNAENRSNGLPASQQ